MASMSAGPLLGLRVLELEAIGPAPFAAMLLADMGADVLRVDRAEGNDLGLNVPRRFDTMSRGRRSLTLDLKRDDAAATLLDLAARADVLIEGFRPGVMERLGVGPEVVLDRNPALVYGRMTGWGQDGPLAGRAGHDIDYIALSGALHAIGRADSAPPPPLNLVGDFGGGGLLLGFGIVCALQERQRSGRGQVVDTSMLEGASLLTTMFAGLRAAGLWHDTRGSNSLDSGAPWYDSYETADGGYMAVGALETKFYADLVRGLGFDLAALPDRSDRSHWPELRRLFTGRFRERTRDEWSAVFADSDACVVPVLDFAEAPRHAQALARQSFVTFDGIEQPSAAPRLSRTPGAVHSPPPERGSGGREALVDWGYDQAEIAALRRGGAGFID